MENHENRRPDMAGSLPAMPPPPKRKPPTLVIASVVVVLGLIGIGALTQVADNTETPTVVASQDPALTYDPPTYESPDISEPLACIDRAVAIAGSSRGVRAITAGVEAMDRLDLDTAADRLMEAADALRQSESGVQNMPQLENALLSAADLYEAASWSIRAADYQGAIKYMRQATQQMNSATLLVEGAEPC
jgi:hypothetical protein